MENEAKRKGCILYVLPDNSVVIQGFSYENHSPGFVFSHVRARISEDLIPVLLGSLVLSIAKTTKLVDLQDWAKDSDLYSKAFLSFAGYKNYKSLEKESACIMIEFENNVISITPTEYDPKFGGFSHLVDKKVTCSPDPESISEHLIPLLEHNT